MDKKTSDMKVVNQVFDIAPSQNPVGYSSDTLRRLIETNRITPIHISKDNVLSEKPKPPITLFQKDSSLYYKIKDNIRENYVTKISGFEVTYDNKVIFHFASIPGGRTTAPVEVEMTDNEIIDLIKAGENVNAIAQKNQPQQQETSQDLGLVPNQTQNMTIFKEQTQSLEPYKQPVQDLSVYEQPVQDLVLPEPPVQQLDDNLSLFDLEQIKQQELEKQRTKKPDQIDDELTPEFHGTMFQTAGTVPESNLSEYTEEIHKNENEEILFAPLFPDMTLIHTQQSQPEEFIGGEAENTQPNVEAITQKVENQIKGIIFDGIGDENQITIQANGLPEDYNIIIKNVGNNNKINLNFVATPIQEQTKEEVKEPEEEKNIEPEPEIQPEPEPEPEPEQEQEEPEGKPEKPKSSKPYKKPGDGKLLRAFMENLLIPSGVFLALIVIGGASLPITPILASGIVASGLGMYMFNKNITNGVMNVFQLPGKSFRMLQNMAQSHQSKKEQFLAQQMEEMKAQEMQFEKECKKYLTPEEQKNFSKEDKKIAVVLKKQQEAKPIIIPKTAPKELPSTKDYSNTIYGPGDIPQSDSTTTDGKKYKEKKDLLAALLKGEDHIFFDEHSFGFGNLHSSNKWKITEDGIKRVETKNESTIEK